MKYYIYYDSGIHKGKYWKAHPDGSPNPYGLTLEPSEALLITKTQWEERVGGCIDNPNPILVKYEELKVYQPAKRRIKI